MASVCNTGVIDLKPNVIGSDKITLIWSFRSFPFHNYRSGNLARAATWTGATRIFSQSIINGSVTVSGLSKMHQALIQSGEMGG